MSFLLDGDAAEYYHSLTKVVQDDWFELMRVLGQRFDCISHEPVYLSRTFLAHANCTLFCAPNAQKRTGSQQGKKTIFFGCFMNVILDVVK